MPTDMEAAIRGIQSLGRARAVAGSAVGKLTQHGFAILHEDVLRALLEDRQKLADANAAIALLAERVDAAELRLTESEDDYLRVRDLLDEARGKLVQQEERIQNMDRVDVRVPQFADDQQGVVETLYVNELLRRYGNAVRCSHARWDALREAVKALEIIQNLSVQGDGQLDALGVIADDTLSFIREEVTI